jgi:hypothetical protein
MRSGAIGGRKPLLIDIGKVADNFPSRFLVLRQGPAELPRGKILQQADERA